MQENIDMWAPWVLCGFCFVAFVLISFCIGLQCEQEKNKIAEQHIHRGNKVFCHYAIEDKNTGELLLFGAKFFGGLNKLVFLGTFKEGVRKIFIYATDIKINGIDCTIKFYANKRECEPYYDIEPAGVKLFNDTENTF